MDKTVSLNMNMYRGLIILYLVAVTHLDNYLGGIVPSGLNVIIMWAGLGWLFFSSGYVLSARYDQQFAPAEALGFLKKRFVRIYPLFLAASIGFFVIFDVHIHKLLSTVTFANLVNGQSMLTMWFVTVICGCYMAYAAWKVGRGKRSAVVLAVVYVTGLVVWRKYGLGEFRFYLYLPIFFAGAVCFRYARLEKFLCSRPVVVVSALLWVALIVVQTISPLKTYQSTFFSPLLAIPLMLRLSHTIPQTFSGRRPFAVLAYASYVMFLLHRMVFTYLAAWVDGNGLLVKAAVMVLIGVPLVILLSYYIQLGYDSFVRGVIYRKIPVGGLPDECVAGSPFQPLEEDE